MIGDEGEKSFDGVIDYNLNLDLDPCSSLLGMNVAG